MIQFKDVAKHYIGSKVLRPNGEYISPSKNVWIYFNGIAWAINYKNYVLDVFKSGQELMSASRMVEALNLAK